MILIKSRYELMQFAGSLYKNLSGIVSAKVNKVSLIGDLTKQKYSLRLNPDIKTIIRISRSEDRGIELNPKIAIELSAEAVVISIMWAFMRSDFSEGSAGDIECDTEALETVLAYLKDFDTAKFLFDFDKLVNKNNTNAARVLAVKTFLDKRH